MGRGPSECGQEIAGHMTGLVHSAIIGVTVDGSLSQATQYLHHNYSHVHCCRQQYELLCV